MPFSSSSKQEKAALPAPWGCRDRASLRGIRWCWGGMGSAGDAGEVVSKSLTGEAWPGCGIATALWTSTPLSASVAVKADGVSAEARPTPAPRPSVQTWGRSGDPAHCCRASGRARAKL